MVRPGEAPAGAVTLDTLDRRIVQVLRPDARRSYASIARALGVSEPTVRNRVGRLIRAGAILPWARVNPAAIGFPVDAMVGIRVKQGFSRQVGAKLCEIPNVSYVGYTTGSFDILIEVHLPDNEGLFRFLNDDLEAIEGVAYKETWHMLHIEKANFDWEGETVTNEPLDGVVPATGRMSA